MKKLSHIFSWTGNIHACLWILQTSVWHPQGFLEISHAVHQLPLLGTTGKFGVAIDHSSMMVSSMKIDIKLYPSTGPMPEWHGRSPIRQPIPGPAEDPRAVHTEVHLPDQRAPVKVDRPVGHLQHDLHLPHALLHHDQGERGRDALDPGLHREEKASEEGACHRQDAFPERLRRGSGARS